jgi:hypothetical protein
MDLKIIEVVFDKKGENEYVLLEVLKDSKLEGYELHGETYSYNDITRVQRYLFNFPEWEVKKGDLIRVYSGVGWAETRIGSLVIHCFYTGLYESIWFGPDKAKLLWVKSPFLNSQVYNQIENPYQSTLPDNSPPSPARWFDE